MSAGSRIQGERSTTAVPIAKNPTKTELFAAIATFQRTRSEASGDVDEKGSLPYKPRQLSAMARFDRGRLIGAVKWSILGRSASPDLPQWTYLNSPASRRVSGESPREADLSTQQTGAQAPSR